MSHEVEYYTYKDKKLDKNKVQRNLEAYVERRCWEEGGGLSRNIRWINEECEDYEDAQKYIEEHDKGWYDQLAVKYRNYSNVKETQSLKKLKQQESTLYKKIHDIENKIHYKDVKSSFVSCKKCGSKLATKYITSNYCPLCHKDLRPETTLKSIENYKKKIKDIQKKIKSEKIKQSKKAEIYWLVKIEYHM